MTNIWTIARKEWGTYFYTPIAYVVLCVFLLGMGYNFWTIMVMVTRPEMESDLSVLSYFFGLNFLFWLLLTSVPAVLTMRLFSEERRSGTFEGLMTAPVTNTQVVLGKYLAAFMFYALLWVPTLVYVFLISYFGVPPDHPGNHVWAALTFSFPGAPDPGPILNGYLLTLLVGGSFLAIGLLASACTTSQVSAALIAVVASIILFLVPLLTTSLVQAEWLKKTLDYTNLIQHYLAFNRGVLDTRPIVYHLSLTGFCLFATVKVVEAR